MYFLKVNSAVMLLSRLLTLLSASVALKIIPRSSLEHLWFGACPKKPKTFNRERYISEFKEREGRLAFYIIYVFSGTYGLNSKVKD